MPRQKLTPDEVEEIMVTEIVAAIYPVLIPVEQQDCAIQARNAAHITELARRLWRDFAAQSTE